MYALGNFAINRYLNADGQKDLSKHLPINGSLTYGSAKVNAIRSFPHVSIELSDIQLSDSLADKHQRPPVQLEKLYLRTKLVNWGRKEIAINGVDLEGLTINLLDQENGYSNITHLIRKKIKTETKNNKQGISIDYENTDINISDIELNKIDEQIHQHAHVKIADLKIKNKEKGDVQEVSIDLNDIAVADQPLSKSQKQAIRLTKTSVKLETNEDFSKLKIKDIQLRAGHIHLLSDSLNNSNFAGLFGNKKAKSTSSKTSKKKSKLSIDIDQANVSIDDIDFAMIAEDKNKHLEARIINLGTTIQAAADTSAQVDLKLDVDQLGFNTTKGAYLSNSLVEGQLDVRKLDDHLSIACPALAINQDPFDVTAKLFSDGQTATTLTIEKPDAETSKIRPVLTTAIQKSISSYEVNGPFYAKAHVQFMPGNKNPRVEVDLDVKNKTVMAKGQKIKNAYVDATFVNRMYDDKRQHAEDKRNVRFMIHSVTGKFNDLDINSKNALITSTPKGGDRLIAKANITGSASAASQYLKHDNFYFEDGQFNLSTDINGSLNNIDELIAGTDLNLAMDNLEVHYPEGNTIFPFKILELNKEGEKTIFHFEGFTEKDQRPFHIRGEVDRVESILFPGASNQMQAKANIRASSVSWEGVIALFGKDGIMSSFKKADEKKAKRSMKQTLSGIQQSFQPEVRITIDTVLYGKDIQLLDFKSGVKFDDERTVVLEETSFNIEEANVTMDGEVKINELDFTRFDFDVELNRLDFDALMPKFDYFGVHLMKQIHDQPDNLTMKIHLSGELDDTAGLKPESINADIMYESFAEDKFTGQIRLKANPNTKKVDVVFGHSGHPRSFNHLLGAEKYRFDDGWYTVSFQFNDNFKSLAQMVEESTFNLTVDNAEVKMLDLDLTIPLTRIEVASIDNKAYYHLLLRSDTLQQEISLNGVVDNIRHFAFKDTDKPYKVDLEISSPHIIWDDVKDLMAYQQQDATQTQNGKALKESLAQVLKDFNPDVTLKVDKLEYSKQLNFNDIFAHAYLENNHLIIDKANVTYGESNIQANLSADMGVDDVLPFDLQLNLNNIDINETLEHFEYFNVDELREAKQIEGQIWLDVNLSAEINLEDQGFNTEKTNGEFILKLDNLVVEDLQTIDTIASKIGKEKRFEVLQFAPIQSRIKIKGERIEVYQTEIQSNAIHAFVEGTMDKTSSENLWVSIPINNIKKPDLEVVPDKTGYEGAGKKVYLQVISSNDEENGNMKVHLKKKKYYQERFKAKQFRGYKRINRRERRRLRQEARASQ